MTTVDGLHLLIGVSGLLVCLFRVNLISRDLFSRYAWLSILFVSLGQALENWPLYSRLETVIGVRGSGLLVILFCAVATQTFAHLLAVTLDPPRRGRTLRVVAFDAVMAGLMVAAFLLDPRHVLDPSLHHLPLYYDTSRYCLTIWVPWLTVLARAEGAVFHRARVHRRRAQSGPLRTSLLLVQVGCAGSYIYLALKVSVLVAWSRGEGPETVSWDRGSEVATLMVTLGAVFVACLYPTLAGRVYVLREQRQNRRDLQRLVALRHRLATLSPGVPALDVPVRGTSLRLTAEVAKLRDLQRHLLRYVPHALPRDVEALGRSAGRDGHQARAIAGAVALLVAVQHRQSGREPLGAPVAAPPGGADLKHEVQALLDLRKALDDPLTDDLLQHVLDKELARARASAST